MIVNLSWNLRIIEMNAARKILFLCNLGCRRDGNTLLVYPELEGNSLFIPPNTTQNPIAAIQIDEGKFPDVLCLDDNGDATIIELGSPWWEFLDSERFLRTLVVKFNPSKSNPPSNAYMTGIRRTKYLQEVWIDVLKEITIEGIGFK